MHTTNCSAEEIIFSNLAFSRYAKRLLESEPNLRTELLQNIQHVFLGRGNAGISKFKL